MACRWKGYINFLPNIEVLSFWKSLLTLECFTDSILSGKWILNSITSVVIKNDLPDSAAGVLTDFYNCIGFLSPYL